MANKSTNEIKRPVTTKDAPAAIGPYSQAIEAGGFVFVSGQIPLDPKTNKIVTDIKEATLLVFKNMEAILKSSGLNLDDVVKTTVFMTNLEDFPKMNEVYESKFKAPYPARSTVGVSALPKGVTVEAECIAVKHKSKK